jgi:hypothetical protein
VSYPTEVQNQQPTQTLVTVIASENNCSLQEALDMAIVLRDRLMSLFLQLRDQLLPDARPDLRRYLICLGHLIRGNIEWSLSVPRYSSEPLTARWTAEPATGECPPLPCLDWWWDLLDQPVAPSPIAE